MHRRTLVKTTLSLQKFDAMQQSAKLILPASTSGKKLFQHESAVTYLLFVPHQAAEIIESTKHCARKQTACAKSRTGRNGRKQRHLYATAECTQLLLQAFISFH